MKMKYNLHAYVVLKTTLTVIIPSPTKLRRDIVTLPCFRNILVNTLESTFFNGF